jgi:hypothetical protein
MDIKELSNYNFGDKKTKIEDDEFTYKPSFYQKNLASLVDGLIVLVLRLIFIMILSTIWYYWKLKNGLSIDEIQGENGIKYLFEKGIFYEIGLIIILTIFIGGLYYTFFFSSKYNSTLGGILMDIKLKTKSDEIKLSFLRCFTRYILHLMPILFVLIIIIQYRITGVNLLTIFLALLTFVWYDTGLIIKGTSGMPNLLTKTELVSNKKRKKPFAFLKSYVKKS